MIFRTPLDVEQLPQGAGESPPDFSEIKILLVDDDVRNLDILEAILDLPGYRLVRARSATAALEALMADSFALIVLDIRMPDMSGLELAQMIKQRKKTQHLPIIFLTAYYGEDEHVLQGYDAGGVDYLAKPCNPTVLRSKVAAFVDLYRVNRALQDEVAERKLAEQRVAERTAEVHVMVQQLRALASELSQAEQRERKRLARFLHDHIQQLLVCGQMHLTRIRRDPTAEEVIAITGEIEAILKEALEASRSLTVELCPPVLQDAGLGPALVWLGNRLAEKHDFHVTVETDPDAEPAIEEERFLLFECVRELLFNAIKHSRTNYATVSLTRQDESRVKLVVADEGEGFDMEEMRERTNRRVTYGLFSIQQRIMHFGGQMHIDARPGKGVRVTLTANATEAAQPLGERAPAPRLLPTAGSGLPGERIRVLLVDDHKIMRQGLAGLLQMEPDMEVVGEAEDGALALELADQLQPDVIIMDINLGQISGLHVTRTVKTRYPHIGVVALSMHPAEEASEAMLSAGASVYITKGGAVEDVLAAVRSCAARNAVAL